MKNKTELVGHRGAERFAPENTRASFEKAIELCYDRIECDVQLTSDGKAIIFHDDTFERTTDTNGKVDETHSSQIKNIRCAEGEEILFLGELLEEFAGRIPMQIELKAQGSARVVAQHLKKHPEADVRISSFDIELLKEMKKQMDIDLCYLFKTHQKGLFATLKQEGIRWAGPKATICTQELIDEMHESGLNIYTYHTNEDEQLQGLHGRVEAVGTNYTPKEVQAALERDRHV